MLAAGTNVVRINFSHGNADEQRRRVERVRDAAAKLGVHVGILGDLQGPKIRIERFRDGRVQLQRGDKFVLDAQLDPLAGDQNQVGITYKDLPNDLNAGDVLLLDDGRLVLDVERIEAGRIYTRVQVGGELSNNKGINRQGGGLSAPSLTDKDRQDIRLAAALGVDYLAVSFPRSAYDIVEARSLVVAAGGKCGIVAKIERAEVLDMIEDIISASDAIMVARGDLGVEIGDAELPAVQKSLISKARSLNRLVITATQMMESMIHNPIPTRAEVFDVANAVQDGTDAVMLSAETAVGRYPAKVIETVARVCVAAEHPSCGNNRNAWTPDDSRFLRVDEAIAMATMYTANHLGVKAIAALTESGSTPLWMSRVASTIPIYALTRHDQTSRKVSLYRGVYPAKLETISTDHARVNMDAVNVLLRENIVQDGDLVIITKGDLTGVHGGTNAMKIVRVGELVEPRS